MKTANKLALTAQANQNKQKQVDVFKDHKLVFTGNKYFVDCDYYTIILKCLIYEV